MSFHGGHRYQMFQSTHVPSFNPPSLGLLCDLIDLVDQIVHGKIVGRISNVDNIMELEPVLYAAYGRAEIQYKASNLTNEDSLLYGFCSSDQRFARG